MDGSESLPQLLRQLTVTLPITIAKSYAYDTQEAEKRIPVAISWKSACETTLDAAEICLRALKLTSDPDAKQMLDVNCRKLLDQAERFKSSESWPTEVERGTSHGVPHDRALHSKELKQPVSTRALSTREQIVLLKGSKMDGCVFPPWSGHPSPEEFELHGAGPFE